MCLTEHDISCPQNRREMQEDGKAVTLPCTWSARGHAVGGTGECCRCCSSESMSLFDEGTVGGTCVMSSSC